jgi:hypothetical protein
MKHKSCLTHVPLISHSISITVYNDMHYGFMAVVLYLSTQLRWGEVDVADYWQADYWQADYEPAEHSRILSRFFPSLIIFIICVF